MLKRNQALTVFWYKHPASHGNFGDELNPYLISKLSGRPVVFAVPYYDTTLNIIKTLLYLLFKKRSVKEFISFSGWNTLFNRKIILGIGSIISAATKYHVVWGSGIIKNDEKIGSSNFLAVRGKYTQNRLRELGHEVPHILGDPAILLPLVYHPVMGKTYRIGLIPHYVHYDELCNRYKDSNIKIINLLDTVETVIDDIISCELTFSSSLHGIIVSHAYGIASLWTDFALTDVLAGDNVKFDDYFSSVDIVQYMQIPLTVVENTINTNKPESLADIYANLVLPSSKKIMELQKELLSVAPFGILSKYRKNA